MTLVEQRVALPGGELRVLQPSEAAELPDDGPVEWAPLMPYWSVLWRSGLALAREVAEAGLAGRRVVELGCGLAVPSLAAARGGAAAVATDVEPEALELARRNASGNGLAIETAVVDWVAPGDLVARGPFDLVLAADVLYERDSVPTLMALLPLLADEVWLADPGRPASADFVAEARRHWSVTSNAGVGADIHRLRANPRWTARRRGEV